MAPEESNQLCLECAMCCNGVIFADVRLRQGDDASLFQSVGDSDSGTSQPSGSKSAIRVPQPCPALNGCRCEIYQGRPKYCAEFECLLLKQVKAGRLQLVAARRIIRSARGRADKVQRLLRELGDHDEHLALSRRFRRIKKKLESGKTNEETADLFGQLSLAVHDLNLLLSDAFYPGR